jgi:hypothetical protein
MPDAQYHASPDVVFTRLAEDEGVLLHLGTQRYYSLNETGIAIWEQLTSPRSLPEVAEAICAAYDVDAEPARVFVERFVAELGRDGLILEKREA